MNKLISVICLQFIKNVHKDDAVLLTIPAFERAVSRVLRDIRVVRRQVVSIYMSVTPVGYTAVCCPILILQAVEVMYFSFLLLLECYLYTTIIQILAV